MRQLFLLILSIGLLFSCDETPSSNQPKKSEIIGDTIFSYYSSGAIKAKKPFVLSKPSFAGDTVLKRISHGKTIRYFENGIVNAEVEYVDGSKHGITKTYYDNGALYCKEEFKNGSLHGEKVKYNLYGKVILKAFYEKGNHVKTSEVYDYEGNRLKPPRLTFEVQDERLTRGKAKLKIELENRKKVAKAKYFLVTKFQNGTSWETELPVKRGVAIQEYSLPANMMYVAKVYVVARCRMKSGDYIGVVDSYNMVLKPF